MKTAENPATAMLFFDWLMQEGQQVLVDSEATPAISDEDLGVELYPVDGEKLLESGDEWSSKYDELLAGAEEISE
jgi:iron(III) transport system substrate-binding protein